MSPLSKLSELLTTLPGIGPRHAERLAYVISNKDTSFLKTFQKTLNEIEHQGTRCSSCRGLFFADQAKGSLICPLCSDSRRDPKQLVVTETEINRNSIEKSGVTGGYYFILGTALPVTETGTDRLPVKELTERIRTLADHGLSEIIMAFNFTPESEHTAELLKKSIEPTCSELELSIRLLGRGFSTGTEVEYSDPDTLRHAFENRS